MAVRCLSDFSGERARRGLPRGGPSTAALPSPHSLGPPRPPSPVSRRRTPVHRPRPRGGRRLDPAPQSPRGPHLCGTETRALQVLQGSHIPLDASRAPGGMIKNENIIKLAEAFPSKDKKWQALLWIPGNVEAAAAACTFTVTGAAATSSAPPPPPPPTSAAAQNPGC